MLSSRNTCVTFTRKEHKGFKPETAVFLAGNPFTFTCSPIVCRAHQTLIDLMTLQEYDEEERQDALLQAGTRQVYSYLSTVGLFRHEAFTTVHFVHPFLGYYY